jgi:Na+/pantothenate symporter
VNAQAWRRFHAIAAVAWMFPGVLVAYLIVFALPDQRLAAFAILVVSLYANAVGHWGAYQATRAESVADPSDQSLASDASQST